jgi:hypothetical protein
MWQGIGGAMADGVFDLFNTGLAGMMSYATDKKLMKKQFKYQKELQRIQNEYNVYNYQHQNQWRVDDLRAAGLNPILSATSGTSVAPASAGAVGLASSKFHPSSSDRFMRLAMQSAELNSARAKSEIEANEASATKSLAEAKATTSMARQNAEKFNIMLPAIKKQAEYESSTSHQWSRHVNDWTQALSPVLDMVPGTVFMRGVGNFLKRGSSSARGLNRDLKSTGYYDLEPSASKGHRWLHVDGDGGFRDSNDDGFTPRYRK